MDPHAPIASAAREPFTSDLTVNELLLLADAGWEPVSLVTGDCGYRVPPRGSAATSRELSAISDALNQAQARALDRLRQQASDAGAEGVIGVAFEPAEPAEHGEIWHFTATGTAVRRIARQRSARKQSFTSHLSGQDTWALLNAGCAPLGVVFGFSVYHSKSGWRRLRDVCEMAELTDALYSARENAMRHMQAQAKRLSANGVVGVGIEMKMTDGPTITFAVVGTAIATPTARVDDPGPRVAVSLTDAPGHPRRTDRGHLLS